MNDRPLSKEEKLQILKERLQSAQGACAELRQLGFKVEVTCRNVEDPYKTSVEYQVWRPA